MKEIRLRIVEGFFADVVWNHAPLSTKELVALCRQKFNWKRTTTYTVLKKTCEKGIFHMENSTVTVLISKAELSSIQSKQFVDRNFGGSLPAFLRAYLSGISPSNEELQEIRQIIDAVESKAK